MQNKGKISLPAFVACHKKTVVVLVVLLIVVISAIAVPLAYVNERCFTFEYDASSNILLVSYRGFDNKSFTFALHSSNPNNHSHLPGLSNVTWNPLPESRIIEIPTHQFEWDSNTSILIESYEKGHGGKTIVAIYKDANNDLLLTWY